MGRVVPELRDPRLHLPHRLRDGRLLIIAVVHKRRKQNSADIAPAG
jgi:hypothetical protein